MQKRWVLKSVERKDKIEVLSKDLGINHILSLLLIQRNIESFEQARCFFRPDFQNLHDPFAMKDMGKAIDRIQQALLLDQKILIYGDYDVDGTTAVALLYNFFENENANIGFYIPDRYKEGYGISKEGIDYAVANGYALIIAVDCGIRSINEIEYAKGLNLDFIIADHHLPGTTLPDAFAVLDPKRHDCPYPYKELSGCGIAFKIAQAYLQRKKRSPEPLKKYLDLVAISIAADIVPITGENRNLAQLGMKVIREEPNLGIKKLIELCKRPAESISFSDLGFQIGPRINAAGRINHGKEAVELLISKNSIKAQEIAISINHCNETRKNLDQEITQHALRIIEQDSTYSQKMSTILYHPEWHKGVIGIVASRLIEHFYRPTIVFTKSNGLITGSARSIYGIDMHYLLEQCKDLLVKFGGHTFAAGMTLVEENIEAFQERFNEILDRTADPQLLFRRVSIDCILNLGQIDSKFINILKQFEPFGPENPRPLFMSKNLEICGSPYIIGTNHLKFSVKQSDSLIFDCIGFNLGEYVDLLSSGIPFEMCYTIEENSWNGKSHIQLNVREIRKEATNN